MKETSTSSTSSLPAAQSGAGLLSEAIVTGSYIVMTPSQAKEICRASMEDAVELADRVEGSMIVRVDEILATKTKVSRAVSFIKAGLRKHGGEDGWAPKSKVFASVYQPCGAAAGNKALELLMDGGYIEERVLKTRRKGPNPREYRLVDRSSK